jgi:hypothetical protein
VLFLNLYKTAHPGWMLDTPLNSPMASDRGGRFRRHFRRDRDEAARQRLIHNVTLPPSIEAVRNAYCITSLAIATATTIRE